MPFSAGVVLQLHRDLYQFLPGDGGRWKPADNKITEKRPDGTEIIRFDPAPAYLTPEYMQRLHERFGAM